MLKPIAEPLATDSPSAISQSAKILNAEALGALALSAIILGGLSLSVWIASPTPARAEVQYPWCVQYGGQDGDGGTNCGFVTREQCQATASGAGYCYENPAYPAAPPPRRKTRRPR